MKENIELTEKERQLVETFPLPCAVMDERGRMIQLNRSWQNRRSGCQELFSELAEGENLLNSLVNRIEEGDDNALKLFLGLSQLTEGDQEFRITYPDGQKPQVVWYRLTARPLCGEWTRFLLVREDVTGSVLAEEKGSINEEVQRKLMSEQRFSDVVLDALPGLFVVLDEHGVIRRFNSGFLRELGYGSDLDHGLNLLDVVDKKDRGELKSAIETVLSEGAVEASIGFRRGDGDIRSYEFSARRFAGDETTYIVATGLDVTEAERTQQENQLNYSLMEQLFEHSPNGIVRVDTENRVQKSNRAFRDLFGYQESDLIDQDIDEMIVCDDDRREGEAAYSRQALSGIPMHRETVRCHRSGREIPVLLGTVPVKVDGEVVAAYGIYVDLTERVHLEERVGRLLADEKKVRQELEVLLQEVHHRVKNNLAVIVGLLDLQMMQIEDPPLENQLHEIQSRVFSIARIHEAIYQHDDFLRVDFDTYVEAMLPSWYDSVNRDTLDLKLEPIRLNVNQAVTFGLLTNELFNLVHLLDVNGAGNGRSGCLCLSVKIMFHWT